MDLLLCGVIYHGEQKHLERLKCRSGVLERLDQQESSMRTNGARPRRGGWGGGRGEGKKRGNDRELRSRRMDGRHPRM